MSPPRRPVRERLMEYFTPATPGECWPWRGPLNDSGYGVMQIFDPATGAWRTRRGHRLVYEMMVGPIPEGLELDHTCVNPRCVNPHHLDPVTGDENKRRAAERSTHCPNGHPYPATMRPGRRRCRRCLAISRRRTRPQQVAWRARRRRELRGPDPVGAVRCECGAEYPTPRALRVHCTRRGHQPASYLPAQRADYVAKRSGLAYAYEHGVTGLRGAV